MYLHFFCNLVVVFVDTRVKCIITACLLFRSRLIHIVRLEKRHRFGLKHKIHNHCCSARKRRFCSRIKVISRSCAHKIELKMSVRVDATRNYQLSFRLNCSCTTWYDQVFANIPFFCLLLFNFIWLFYLLFYFISFLLQMTNIYIYIYT